MYAFFEEILYIVQLGRGGGGLQNIKKVATKTLDSKSSLLKRDKKFLKSIPMYFRKSKTLKLNLNCPKV